MERNAFANAQIRQAGADEVLKATSLLYLRDALRAERYEECAQLAQAARGFGAKREDIRQAIREAQAGQLDELNIQRGQLKYEKEEG